MFFDISVDKMTPKEFDADNDFISKCQNYFEKSGKTLVMYGKLGSGKRTVAAQIALRLAKKDKNLKIKIVRDREVLSKDLEAINSTILVIHDPVKTWYTTRKTEEIISCLLNICTNAKEKKSYIIAIFHWNDWNSLKRQFGKKYATMEQVFPEKVPFCSRKENFTEIAKSNKIEISKVPIQQDRANIGSSIIMTLFLKYRAFRDDNFLSNPTLFICKKLKTLERSSDINDQLAFKILVYVVLHDGIAKLEFDGISHHALFADLIKQMNIEGSINECIEQLLDPFIEKMADGQTYRIMHDIITRCTFLAAVENHWTLLLTECDPVLIFDCIRLKSRPEKIKYSGQIFFDDKNLKIAPPTEVYPEIARLFYQRSEMRSILLNSILYDDENFKVEWNRAELNFTNTDERHEEKCEG